MHAKHTVLHDRFAALDDKIDVLANKIGAQFASLSAHLDVQYSSAEAEREEDMDALRQQVDATSQFLGGACAARCAASPCCHAPMRTCTSFALSFTWSLTHTRTYSSLPAPISSSSFDRSLIAAARERPVASFHEAVEKVFSARREERDAAYASLPHRVRLAPGHRISLISKVSFCFNPF